MTSIVADRLCGSIPMMTRPMPPSSLDPTVDDRRGGQRYFELGRPLTRLMSRRRRGPHPLACRAPVGIGSQTPCRPGLAPQERAGLPAPGRGVARQRRGQGLLGVRLPTTAFPATGREGTPPAVITIGIDPHKASLTAVALDATGEQVAARRVVVNAAAYKTSDELGGAVAARRFAVEGANGLGRRIAQLLAAGGEDVVDVPATLAARARLLGTGGARKTDSADAAALPTSQCAANRLRPVVAEDQTTQLRCSPSVATTWQANASGS